MKMAIGHWWRAALFIPLIGLIIAWGVAHIRSAQGTEWDVPVTGYDPRDLLRGHYVDFRYDWPGLPEDADIGYFGADTFLCIEGRAPQIRRVTVVDNVGRSHAGNDCDATARANAWAEEGMNGVITDRFFIPQARADEYQRRLNDRAQLATMRIRIRPDGHITPLRFNFRPRAAGTTAVEPATARAIEFAP